MDATPLLEPFITQSIPALSSQTNPDVIGNDDADVELGLSSGDKSSPKLSVITTSTQPRLNMPPLTPKFSNSRTSNPPIFKSASEIQDLEAGIFDWKKLKNRHFWFQRGWLGYYVALVIIVIATTLAVIFQNEIIDWLMPEAQWLHDSKFGWLVAIAILFVLSFPPLFGGELVSVLCGLVWGMRSGFIIVGAGTLLGEVGNFYYYKWLLGAKFENLERTKISYACLAKVVRDGGFTIALIVRLSAIPGHFTTAVFSSCGMGIVEFCLAAILSLPKQCISVYLGVILEQSQSDYNIPARNKLTRSIVLGLSFSLTLLAMYHIYNEMNKVKRDVVQEIRKGRKAKDVLTTPSTSGRFNSIPDRYVDNVSDKSGVQDLQQNLIFADHDQLDVSCMDEKAPTGEVICGHIKAPVHGNVLNPLEGFTRETPTEMES